MDFRKNTFRVEKIMEQKMHDLGRMLAFIAGALLLPIFLLTLALAVIFQNRPLFFVQDRIGLHHRVFTIYKVRSMILKHDIRGSELTRFGVWLRKTRLDEIPSFINIVQGDLSWVGPRPLLVQDMEILSRLCPERFWVRPGLTGLAQVAGGNLLSWRRRLSLDASYTVKRSWAWHCMIVVITLFKVISLTRVLFSNQTVSPPLAIEIER